MKARALELIALHIPKVGFVTHPAGSVFEVVPASRHEQAIKQALERFKRAEPDASVVVLDIEGRQVVVRTAGLEKVK